MEPSAGETAEDGVSAEGPESGAPADPAASPAGPESDEEAPLEEPVPALDVEALRREIAEEAPGELVKLNLGDSSVSLRIAGNWKGTLQGSWGMALTPLGVSALSGDTPFFAQEGDLTLSLWIRNRWFVEASFMDDSNLNTYRAGYQGSEGEAVRYVGVGNTGLDFPVFPYLDLGGDSPSSFGVYGHFGAGDLAFHSLFRYDAAAREERVFVGGRERSYSYTPLSRPQRGVSFTLPDSNLADIPEVFLQDSKGNWRRAESSEYGASARYGLIELSLGAYTGGIAEPEGMVAVYYPGGFSNLGTYGDNSGSFLGEAQAHFDPGRTHTRLWDYPQPGQRNPGALGTPANTPGTVVIDGKAALAIYEPGTFSPFERQNRYLAPANTSSSAALVKRASGEIEPGYELIPLEDGSLEAEIQNPDQSRVSRNLYELVPESSRDLRSPMERWPLGDKYPELYLPGRVAFTEDIGIRFTNYSTAGAFYIGTDVASGSVQVYRNGILDPNFIYSPSSGTVSLGNPAGFSETIRIAYLKQSDERRLGSLAAGIGTIWDPEGSFAGKLGLGLRWNIASEAYSDDGASSPGTVGMGAEAKWDFDRLKAGLSLGLGFEQPDTTGLYRVAGMEGNEIVLSLSPGDSFISEAPDSYRLGERADLVYRDYKDTSLLGVSSLGDISSGASIASGESGPYPAMDQTLSSQVLVAEFEFGQGKTWTGFETPLGVNGEFLERAGKIEIPYRLADFSREPLAGELSVSLQIGALADKNSAQSEHPDLQIKLDLYPSAGLFSHEPRIAAFAVTDDMRAKLQGAKYLRLLVAYSGADNLRGKVALAPPIVRGALWRPVTAKANGEISPAKNAGTLGPKVNAVEEIEFGSDRLEDRRRDLLEQLHSENSRQRVLEISWDGFSNADLGAGADGRSQAIPLSNYRSLSFFVRRPLADSNADKIDPDINPDAQNQAAPNPDQYEIDKGVLRFAIARGPDSLQRGEEIALEASIPIKAFKDSGVYPGKWARVDVDYIGSDPAIFVEGRRVSGYRPAFRSSAVLGSAGNPAGGASGTGPNQEEGNVYLAFLLIPGEGQIDFPPGNLAIDEIILEEPLASYRINGGASVEWALPGAVLQAGGRAIVSDLSFQAAVESGAQGNPFEEENPAASSGMNGRTRAGFSLLGLKLAGNYSYSLNNSRGMGSGYTWAAGHELSRAFGPFSIRESFDDAPSDRAMNHRFGAAVNARVKADLSGEAIFEDEKLRRRWQAGTGSQGGDLPLDFSLEAQAGLSEKNAEEEPFENYAEAWLSSFGALLPDYGSEAESRDMRGNFRVGLDTSPLGTELYFQGNSLFSSPRKNLQSSSLARLDFPFNPKESELRLLFRMEREYRRDLFGESPDFEEDGKSWAESFDDAVPLMFSIPFYSLFDSGMGERMDAFGSLQSNGLAAGSYPESSQFADRLEFSVERAMNYGLSSFFLPRRISFRLGRVLERRLDTPRDALNLGAGLGFSSVNMFGAMGAAPLFSFYQGDEFSHALETQIAFPKNEAVSWSVRSDQSMLFFGFSGAELEFNNALTVNSSRRTGEGNRWIDSLSAAWTVPMGNTLLGSVYGAFARFARGQSSWLTLANLAESEYELLRKESLEFIFERVPDFSEEDYNRFSFAIGHESIVRIFGRFNLSVFAKLTVSEDFNTRILSFMGSIGTTLNLTF